MICPAKTRPPESFAHSIAREELLEEIRERGTSVLVLHGKAGYGKTELARQLCAGFGERSAWYGLDSSDNDLKRFLEYLDAILSECLPGYADPGGDSSPEGILCRGDRALSEEGGDFLLVLDSLETVTDQEALEMIRRMAAQWGGKMCLCMITKGRIPDFLSRFVMRGNCRILDEQELAFSGKEERALLERLLMGGEGNPGVLPEPVFETVLEQVHKGLGGWPAGVMLAGMFFRKNGVCQGTVNWPCLVQASLIGGFLDSEVFGELSEEERDFLFRTADMEELDGEICDAVLGRDDSGAMIRSLLEKDIFCYRPSEAPGICRHKIAELYLESCGNPKLASDTARRAAEYCLAKRSFRRAARQAARMGDTSLVLGLMEQFGGELIKGNRWDTLTVCVRYLEETGLLAEGKVPDKRMAGMTEVLGTAAQYYYQMGQTERMEDCLNQADSVFGKENKFGMYRALYRGLLQYGEDEEKNSRRVRNTLFSLEQNHYPLPYLKREEGELLARIRGDGGGEKIGRLKVSFFGEFRAVAEGEGKPLSFRTRKGGELFAYMIRRNGRLLGRRQLLSALWNDEMPDNAVTMLHNMLYNLRKELSAYRLENLIEYREKVYRIHMEQVETDVEEIDGLCRMADREDRRELVKHQERFRVYWGRYLEDVDGLWVLEDREYYDARFMKGCSILAEEALKEGRFGDGALFYRNALLVNGYSEEWEIGLLKSYGMMGNLRQVKNEYQRFCAYVRKELQTEPGEKLNRVYREILGSSQDPADAGPGLRPTAEHSA